MEGPLDRLFGHSAFDLGRDGKMSGAEWAFIHDVVFGGDNGIASDSSDVDDDIVDELDMAGLDRDELEFMDEDERREALEDAGLDPDDFEDEF